MRRKIANIVGSNKDNWKDDAQVELKVEDKDMTRLLASGCITPQGINYLDVSKYLYNRGTEAFNANDEVGVNYYDTCLSEIYEKLSDEDKVAFNAHADSLESDEPAPAPEPVEDDATEEIQNAIARAQAGEMVDVGELSHKARVGFVKWRAANQEQSSVNPPDARPNHASGPDVYVDGDGEEVTELEAAGLASKLVEELDKLYQVRTFVGASHLTRAQVKDIHGVGKKKVEALEDELTKRGLDFADNATVVKVTDLSSDEKRARVDAGLGKIKSGLASATKEPARRSSKPALWIECRPLQKELVKLTSIISDVDKAVSNSAGVKHYRQMEGGRDELIATIVGMARDGALDSKSIFVGSTSLQRDICEAIVPFCGDIFVASR